MLQKVDSRHFLLFTKHGGVIVGCLAFSLLIDYICRRLSTASIIMNLVPSIPLFVLFHFHAHGNSASTFALNPIVQSLLLLLVWSSWLTLVSSPLIILLIQFSSSYNWLVLTILYLPLIVMGLQDQQDTRKSPLFLKFATIGWDIPLMIWIYLSSSLGHRVLGPFYSRVNKDVAIGSMPLPGDGSILKDNNVGYIVNMCREFRGLTEEYAANNIQQLHLPTPDICVPKFRDVLEAVHGMISFHRQNPTKSIFVHCKGGRSRSGIVLLCYLIVAESLTADAAMNLLVRSRSVVERKSLRFKVVKQFIAEYNDVYHGNFDTMYSEHTYREIAKEALLK